MTLVVDYDAIDYLWRRDIETEKGITSVYPNSNYASNEQGCSTSSQACFDASEQYERDLQLLREKSMVTVSTFFIQVKMTHERRQLAQKHFTHKVLRNFGVTTIIKPRAVLFLSVSHVNTIHLRLVWLTKFQVDQLSNEVFKRYLESQFR